MEAEGIGAQEVRLAQAARGSCSALPVADVMAAVEAGMLADAVDQAEVARASAVEDEHPAVAVGQVAEEQSAAGVAVAAEIGHAAATVQRRGLPPSVATPVDWSGFGQVMALLHCVKLR